MTSRKRTSVRKLPYRSVSGGGEARKEVREPVLDQRRGSNRVELRRPGPGVYGELYKQKGGRKIVALYEGRKGGFGKKGANVPEEKRSASRALFPFGSKRGKGPEKDLSRKRNRAHYSEFGARKEGGNFKLGPTENGTQRSIWGIFDLSQ